MLLRQAHGEYRALCTASYTDGPAMGLYDLPGDGQPQPRAARARGARRIQPVELFKNGLPLLFGNGVALIGEIQRNRTCLLYTSRCV